METLKLKEGDVKIATSKKDLKDQRIKDLIQTIERDQIQAELQIELNKVILDYLRKKKQGGK